MEPVYLHCSDGVAELVLNQPARRNAISAAMWEAIPGLLEEAANDDKVRTLIVHGGETGHFAAGADISEFKTVYATPESSAIYSAGISSALEALEAFPKPSLAAIEGACVGGGVSIAMACDLRLASTGSKFAITPGKLGLVYPVQDVQRLIRLCGVSVAKDLLFTGRMIRAEEAGRIGLTDRLCEPGMALEEARSLSGEMMQTSQWSLQATKRMVQYALEDNSAKGDELFLSAFELDDFKEGYDAFLSKRKPDFKWRG